MNGIHLPPLQRLRAFEAAVRLRGFGKAAEELALTQSAVSQHILALEEQFGVRFFLRHPNGVTPTDKAQALALQVRQGLRILERALAEVRPRPGWRPRPKVREHMVISVLPAFASRWLIPRIGRFQVLHPDVDLDIRPSAAVVPFDAEDQTDIAIRYGPGGWPGLLSEKLMDETLFPACSPAYRSEDPPRGLRDLHKCLLLRHLAQPWEPFFQAAGIDLDEPASGPVYADAGLVVDAAVAGQGVALVRQSLAEPDLRAGRLVRLGDRSIDDVHAHFVVWRPDNPKQEMIDAMRMWLKEEAAESP
ncbi:MAG: LysR family transcriptional regulator [Rhizobiales bacterium 65-79]|jgi:DNA-binding transcriptional LysR family regulator|nr:LysR family transcriptional regulator [Hyphomicrobiales bacterium]OJU05292.1 MAG: LysR family transcriptional regulator [Rhizobiales bacterium 65-79]